MKRLTNPHLELPDPPGELRKKRLIRGDYQYWHYICDELDDRGWGCGYRTLQTLCSWVWHQRRGSSPSTPDVPSIPDIQQILVSIQDKDKSFIGSKNWIGSFEVCLVLDTRYDVASKIVHVTKGKELRDEFDQILNHFERFGSPIMMGGDIDCSSKGLFGAVETSQGLFLLVVDPHFYGKEISSELLIQNDWIQWKKIDSDFVDSSFYNLCLPQMKVE